MILKCSANMQTALKIKPDAAAENDRFFSWCAHTFKLGRRNCVVLMNSASRMCAVLYGLKTSDYAKLPENICTYIRQLLKSYQLSDTVIEKYLSDCGPVTLSRNSDRSDVSVVNKLFTKLRDYCDPQTDMLPDALFQELASKKLNRSGLYDKDGKYRYPHEVFFEMLKERYELPLFDAKMYELKITLDFPEFEISRVVRVPVEFTFSQLHKVIQTCYNWQEYHMYEFAEAEDDEIKTVIVNSRALEDFAEDYDDYDAPVIADTQCRLHQMFGHTKTMYYTYDMGDSWQHEIELLSVSDEHDSPYPKCLKVTGKAPPEDCGGIDGYIDLMEQIKQGDEEMIKWAESMQWKDKTPDDISHNLKWQFK